LLLLRFHQHVLRLTLREGNPVFDGKGPNLSFAVQHRHKADSDLSMSLPEATTFLIVGAGPSGLGAAISLVQEGCRDLVIVDAVLEGENTSRAIVVHAATLEVMILLFDSSPVRFSYTLCQGT
jgi:hypothetical protein